MLPDSLYYSILALKRQNTACYVLNRVLVTKPQMKTPYEILMGRSPNISFMRPFGCPLTILNTLDHLGKFEGKSEEGYLLGYSTNSKGFRSLELACKLMHQESLARTYNDDQRLLLKEEKKRIALDKGEKRVFYGIFSTTLLMLRRAELLTKPTWDPTIDKESRKVSQALADESWVEAIARKTTSIHATRELKPRSFWYLNLSWLQWISAGCHECILIMGNTQKEVLMSKQASRFESLLNPTRRGVLIKLLFIKKDRMMILLVQVYVDDLHLSGLQSSMVYDWVSMYLTASDQDIMFVFVCVQSVQVTPKVSHLHAVKRIFRSTSGGCHILGRRWSFLAMQNKTIVAISIRSRLVASSTLLCQVLWMQNQLLDYGFNFMNTEIHIDNESTICIVKNPVFHSKTKHIQIRHHFIRDCYEQRLINVVKVHTDDNVADLLTKGFDLARFNFLVVTIGMMNP
ncbi:hypothetical protein Tco_0200906 [Tanacetum coccineum]